MNILISITIFLIFYMLGRSFVLMTYSYRNTKIDELFIFDTKITVFYPILGMFYLGNTLFIINFFSPLDNRILVLLLFTPILLNIKRKFLNLNLREIFTQLSVFLIINISIYTANFQYDAGFYHLNYQNWLRNEKIVFGLSNLHAPYGLSSISDFIASIFWFDGNFILLHTLPIIFIASLGNFLFLHLSNKKNTFLYLSSLFLTIYIFLDNFGFNGGLNGFIQISGIIKPDQAFAVLFYLFSILFIVTLNKKEPNDNEIIFLASILLFSFQFRVTSLFLFLPFFVFLIIRRSLFNKRLIIKFLLLIFLFLLWSLKSFILSSCFFFPVAISCMNTAWGNSRSAESFTGHTLSFNNSYSLGDNFFDWIQSWFNWSQNSTTLLNFIVSLIAILIFSNLFIRGAKNKIKNITLVFIIYVILVYLAIWIMGSPDIRFFYGGFIFTISLLAIKKINHNVSSFNTYLTYSVYVLFFVSIALIPRVDSYRNFISNPLPFYELKVVDIDYIYDDSRWYFPSTGDQCWINLDCVPSKIDVSESRNNIGNLVFSKN